MCAIDTPQLFFVRTADSMTYFFDLSIYSLAEQHFCCIFNGFGYQFSRYLRVNIIETKFSRCTWLFIA